MDLRGILLHEKKSLQRSQVTRTHLNSILEVASLQRWRIDERLPGVRARAQREVAEATRGILEMGLVCAFTGVVVPE